MSQTKPLWRQVLDLYRPTSLGFKIKLFIRWKHGDPFERLEPYIPAHGRIIDVGCGSGFFANLLALTAPARQVLGVDIDERQIQRAQRSVGQRTNARFEVRNLMQETLPSADAVVFIDVLHHMRFEEQDHVLGVCHEALAPSGALFVLDDDVKPRWKYWYNRLCDSATGLLQITRGSTLSYQSSVDMTARLQRAGFGDVQVIPFAHFDLAPRVLFIAKPKRS
jgi:2-polyprenyl-3-methyl-5-hydroxy-6-metoxy-1,4-benzoquinol methylase